MSPENDIFYYHNKLKSMEENWKILRNSLLTDVLRTVHARMVTDSDEKFIIYRGNYIFAENILAAEIFPDSKQSRIIIGTQERETHADLREKNPSKEPRLSGNIITIFNGTTKLFMIDGYLTQSGEGFTQLDVPVDEVTCFLLDNGYIPVDAELNLIKSSRIDVLK